MPSEAEPIWTPGAARIAGANITAFMRWLSEHRGLAFSDYAELWCWSSTEIEAFWQAIWDYCGIRSSTPHSAVLTERRMPGADWFPGARLNYAEHVLGRAAATGPAMLHFDDHLTAREVGRAALIDQVLRMAQQLRAMGIKPGDRIVACMPNRPETIVAMLATASIGAVWSVVSPETGVEAMTARFAQLEPRLLFTVDSYSFRGRLVDRRNEVSQLIERLPTLGDIIWLPSRIDLEPPFSSAHRWDGLLDQAGSPPALDRFAFEQVPFSHPLWILFSSGTTGLPKAMMHSHGGMLVEQLKFMTIHMDLHPGDRILFYTITGWMMWNFLIGSMLAGAVPVLFDGHPTDPEPDRLWCVAAASRANVFGASPSYVKLQQQAGCVPRDGHDLSALRSILLSGSPASRECMQWFLDAVAPELWVQSGSGGTDVCSGFVGGVPILPVHGGEIQARCLGVAAAAFDEAGMPVVDQVGELVITQPMPSMPVGFWNDPGEEKYLDAYFSTYAGVWRQGDFFLLNKRGGCFVLGRSDATLNRQGVRIGTAEIYAAMDSVPEVEDSLIVNLEMPGGAFWMPLFVCLTEGCALDAGLDARIRAHLRTNLSPRHVPDEIVVMPGIPYTATGKRLEVPVRRILMGTPIDQAIGKGTADNADLIARYQDYAHQLAKRHGTAGT